MTMAAFIKENFQFRLFFSFRDLVYLCHGRKHGGRQAGMVLEKELRVLHLDPQAAGSELSTTLGIA